MVARPIQISHQGLDLLAEILQDSLRPDPGNNHTPEPESEAKEENPRCENIHSNRHSLAGKIDMLAEIGVAECSILSLLVVSGLPLMIFFFIR